MKVRLGFVSNSSSSSFFFCFKNSGNDDIPTIKENIIKLIMKYKNHFSLTYFAYIDDTEGRVDASDVVEAIRANTNDCKSSESNFGDAVFNNSYILTIDEAIAEQKAILKDFNDSTLQIRQESWHKNLCKERIKIINKFNDARQKEQTTVVKIEFGDSHGITGPVGHAMDYDFTEFNNDDLSVIKISNH